MWLFTSDTFFCDPPLCVTFYWRGIETSSKISSLFICPNKNWKKKTKMHFFKIWQSPNLTKTHHKTSWDFHRKWSYKEWWSGDRWHDFFVIGATICTLQEIQCLLCMRNMYFWVSLCLCNPLNLDQCGKETSCHMMILRMIMIMKTSTMPTTKRQPCYDNHKKGDHKKTTIKMATINKTIRNTTTIKKCNKYNHFKENHKKRCPQ